MSKLLQKEKQNVIYWFSKINPVFYKYLYFLHSLKNLFHMISITIKLNSPLIHIPVSPPPPQKKI